VAPTQGVKSENATWLVHEGRWQIVLRDSGDYLAIPPQTDWFSQLARGPDVGAVA
jgi:hypothetical protein